MLEEKIENIENCSSIGLMNPHRVRHWKFMIRSYCGLQVTM